MIHKYNIPLLTRDFFLETMNEAFENGLIVLLNKFISEELWDDYDSFSTVL